MWGGVCYSETFSFMLTGEDGSRRFGYCRRLLVSTSLSVLSKYKSLLRVFIPGWHLLCAKMWHYHSLGTGANLLWVSWKTITLKVLKSKKFRYNKNWLESWSASNWNKSFRRVIELCETLDAVEDSRGKAGGSEREGKLMVHLKAKLPLLEQANAINLGASSTAQLLLMFTTTGK